LTAWPREAKRPILSGIDVNAIPTGSVAQLSGESKGQARDVSGLPEIGRAKRMLTPRTGTFGASAGYDGLEL